MHAGIQLDCLAHRVLPKRAMVVTFVNDEKSLLVGDKFGEVYLYTLDDWDAPGEHLLGHFSILLDMVRFVGDFDMEAWKVEYYFRCCLLAIVM